MRKNGVPPLAAVLQAREERAAYIASLCAERRAPVVSFTMNIAGAVKTSPAIEWLFFRGIKRLRNALPELSLVKRIEAETGPECFFIYCKNDAALLKKKALEIEEKAPGGRLYDIDVYDGSAIPLKRTLQRSCIVCGKPVFSCSRRRAHGLAAILKRQEELISHAIARELAEAARDALIAEAKLTPKPGLVDQTDNGAHKDMHLSLLIQSADSLTEYFEAVARESFQRGIVQNEVYDNYFITTLRSLGETAEEIMLRTTGGINTHRGAIYEMGLILSAFSSLLIDENIFFSNENECEQESSEDGLQGRQKKRGISLYRQDPAYTGTDGIVFRHSVLRDKIFRKAAALARALDTNSRSDPLTHGNYVRHTYGVTGGAKQEALDGFPHLQAALRFAEKKHIPESKTNKSETGKNGKFEKTGTDNEMSDENAADKIAELFYLSVLVHLMAHLPDTNLLYRGGREGLLYVQKTAALLPEKVAADRTKLLRRSHAPDSSDSSHLPEFQQMPETTGGLFLREALVRANRAFIRKNLSPGGSADLLSLAYLINDILDMPDPS